MNQSIDSKTSFFLALKRLGYYRLIYASAIHLNGSIFRIIVGILSQLRPEALAILSGVAKKHRMSFYPASEDLEKFRKLYPRISLKDLSESEIPPLLDYWFRSPPGFIESLGADLGRLGSEEKMRESLLSKINEAANNPDYKIPTLVIWLDGEPIGSHSVSHINEPIAGEAVFHSHIWNEKWRGKGVSLVTYLLGAEIFLNRFELVKLRYETPKINPSPNRVKEKLGIRRVGEALVTHPMCRSDLAAWIYELTREDLERLKRLWLS